VPGCFKPKLWAKDESFKLIIGNSARVVPLRRFGCGLAKSFEGINQ